MCVFIFVLHFFGEYSFRNLDYALLYYTVHHCSASSARITSHCVISLFPKIKFGLLVVAVVPHFNCAHTSGHKNTCNWCLWWSAMKLKHSQKLLLAPVTCTSMHSAPLVHNRDRLNFLVRSVMCCLHLIVLSSVSILCFPLWEHYSSVLPLV